MRHSPTIGAISAALAKAQGELKNPEKNRTATIKHKEEKGGGQHSYTYVDLPALLDCIRSVLAKYEITYAFGLSLVPEGTILTGMLSHASGEWFASDFPIAGGLPPKQLAIDMSYGRRIVLQALVGVAGEDDDDAPSEHVGRPGSRTAPQTTGGPFQFKVIKPMSKPGLTEGAITEPQRKRLWAICKDKGWSVVALKEFLKLYLGIESGNDIHWKDYNALCGAVENLRPETAIGMLMGMKGEKVVTDTQQTAQAPGPGYADAFDQSLENDANEDIPQ